VPITRLPLFISILIAGVAWSTPAAAQSSTPSAGPVHGQFLFYAASGTGSSTSSLVHLGGGGEAAIRAGFGIGTEFGGIVLSGAARPIGTLAVNVSWHVRGQHPRFLDPYVSAGLGAYVKTPDGTHAGPTAAAGLTYWFGTHRGYQLGAGVELRQNRGLAFRELRFSIRLWQ